MAESQIRWRRSDYVTLGKAVANFNRKINELNKEEKKKSCIYPKLLIIVI